MTRRELAVRVLLGAAVLVCMATGNLVDVVGVLALIILCVGVRA